MTQLEREQAAGVLDILADRLQYFASTDAMNALDTAICALRGPQPGPATGLVPCGCGGRPTFHHAYIAKGDKCYFECTACGARGALRLDEERARYSWNTAMGWRAEK